MSNTNFIMFQVVMGSIQAGLLIYQVFYNRKTYKKDISDKLGFFELTETNLQHVKEYANRYKDFYDLAKNISFKNIGSDKVIVLGEQLIINNIIHRNSPPSNTIFNNEGRFNILSLGLELKEHHLQMNELNVVILFKLKNSKGYLYRQEIIITFIKKENKNWEQIRYNSEIK